MPYGYRYDRGYAPFNPAYGGPMVPWGGTYMGEAPAPAPERSMWQKTKDFMNEKAVDDIPNWALLGGAVVIGTVWYGYSQDWFG